MRVKSAVSRCMNCVFDHLLWVQFSLQSRSEAVPRTIKAAELPRTEEWKEVERSCSIRRTGNTLKNFHFLVKALRPLICPVPNRNGNNLKILSGKQM